MLSTRTVRPCKIAPVRSMHMRPKAKPATKEGNTFEQDAKASLEPRVQELRDEQPELSTGASSVESALQTQLWAQLMQRLRRVLIECSLWDNLFSALPRRARCQALHRRT